LSKRTHDNAANEQKLTIMPLEPRKRSVGKDSAERRAETGGETSQTDFDWVWAEHGLEHQGEEIQHGVKVHAWTSCQLRFSGSYDCVTYQR
jgi:hypothetical protein